MKRYKDAHAIFNMGACNPSGIAKSIAEACEEIRNEPDYIGGTAQLCRDPAIRAMVYQLASLCGMEPLALGDEIAGELALKQTPLLTA